MPGIGIWTGVIPRVEVDTEAASRVVIGVVSLEVGTEAEVRVADGAAREARVDGEAALRVVTEA